MSVLFQLIIPACIYLLFGCLTAETKRDWLFIGLLPVACVGFMLVLFLGSTVARWLYS